MWVECVGINLNSWLSHLRRHSNTPKGCAHCLLGEEFSRGSLWNFVGQICPIRLRIGTRLYPICEKKEKNHLETTHLLAFIINAEVSNLILRSSRSLLLRSTSTFSS